MVARPTHLTAVAGPIPVIAYIRVSKGREQMISPDIQRKVITDWCKANGRYVVAWVEDLNNTGREFAKRKILRTIARIEAGEAAEVAVYKFDRWGRNATDALANCKRAENVGGQVKSATEPFDPDTAIGRYSRTNAFALAEMQSDIISEGWKLVQENRLERGLTHNGGPRFGYTYTARKDGGDGLYHPDPVAGPALVECYQRLIAGEHLATLAKDLNNAGIHTVTGHRWDQVGLRRVMESGFAAGLIKRGNPPVYSPASHEPLIDEATWEAFKARRVQMKARHPRLAKAVYRLSGLMLCPQCGAPMVHQRAHNRVRVLCSRWQRTKSCGRNGTTTRIVEGAVLAWLEDLVGDQGGELERQVALEAKASVIEVDTGLLERELKETQRQQVKLVEGHLRGLYPDEAYQELAAELAGRVGELKAALESFTAPVHVPTAAISGVVEAWESTPPQWQNESLRTLIAAVVCYPEPMIFGTWEL